MKKRLKLKHIIKYLDPTDSVIIWQEDVYIDEHQEEKIFEGSVMDIPWILLNYYIAEGEGSISGRIWEYEPKLKSGLILYVRSD